jgi:hypothetical protein
MASYLHSLTNIIDIDISAYRLRDFWPLIATGKRFDNSISAGIIILS